MAQRRADALARLPGWRWVGDVGGAKAPSAPISLPPGLEHGRAGAISRGCKCQTCLTARRAKDNAYTAQRKAAQQAAGIDAARAREHLHQLEQELTAYLLDSGCHTPHRTTGRALIASTAGVPLPVIRSIAGGQAQRVSREHQTRILALTLNMCVSNLSTSGSRGRLVQREAGRVPAAATKALVADLQSRGFDLGWIGRELGLTKSLQLHGQTCTRHTARQLAELHQRTGDLIAPRVPHGRRVPPLRQLLTAGNAQPAAADVA